MDRKRTAIVAGAILLAVAAVLALLAAQPWGRPSDRTRVVVRGVHIDACFTIHIVNPGGATVGTVGPECTTRSISALNGTYFGNTTASLPVPIDFLDPGNATCAGLLFARYQIQSGWIDRFAVDAPFHIDGVTPPSPWDVVNYYGGRGYLGLRMPDQPFDGTMRISLTGLLNSPDGVPPCP